LNRFPDLLIAFAAQEIERKKQLELIENRTKEQVLLIAVEKENSNM
jgi:hypothetical protein